MSISHLPLWADRLAQSKDRGPDRKCPQGRKPQVPNKEQNRENKDLAPGVTFPPGAYLWLCSWDPTPAPHPDLSSSGLLLVMHDRPLRGGRDKKTRE